MIKRVRYTDTANPKFSLLERKVLGFKYTVAKNESLKKVDNDLAKMKEPDMGTYNQDDRVLHEKLRTQVWAKMKEKAPY